MINRALMNRQMFANGGAVARSPSNQGEMDAISRDLLRLQREGTTDEVYNFMLERENSLKQDPRFQGLLESPGYLMFKQNRREQPRGMQEGGSVAPMGMPPVGGPMVPMGEPPPVGLGPAMGAAMPAGLPEGGAAALEGLLAESQGRLEGMDGAQNYEEMINALRGDQAPLEERREELAGLVGPEDASQTPESVLTLVQPVIMMAEVDQGIGSLPMGDMMSAPVEGNMADGIMTTVNMGAEAPVEGVPAPVNFNQGGAVQYMQPGGVAGFDQLNVRPPYRGALEDVDRSFTPLTPSPQLDIDSESILDFLGSVARGVERNEVPRQERKRRAQKNYLDFLGSVTAPYASPIESAIGTGIRGAGALYQGAQDLIGTSVSALTPPTYDEYIQSMMRDSSQTSTEDGVAKVVEGGGTEVVKGEGAKVVKGGGEDGVSEVVEGEGAEVVEGGSGSTFEAIANGAISGGDLLSSAEENFPRYLRLIQESLGSDPESRADAAKKAAQSSALFGLSRAAFEYAKSGDFADAAGKGVESLSAATQGLRQEQLALDEQEKALRTAALQGSIDLATSEAKIAADLAEAGLKASNKLRDYRLVLQNAPDKVRAFYADPNDPDNQANMREIRRAIFEASVSKTFIDDSGQEMTRPALTVEQLAASTTLSPSMIQLIIEGDVSEQVRTQDTGYIPNITRTNDEGEEVATNFLPDAGKQLAIIGTKANRLGASKNILNLAQLLVDNEFDFSNLSDNEKALVNYYSNQFALSEGLEKAIGLSRIPYGLAEKFTNVFGDIFDVTPEENKASIEQAEKDLQTLGLDVQSLFTARNKDFKDTDATRILSQELSDYTQILGNFDPSLFKSEQATVNGLQSVRSTLGRALRDYAGAVEAKGAYSQKEFPRILNQTRKLAETYLRVNSVINTLTKVGAPVFSEGTRTTNTQVSNPSGPPVNTTDTADIF